MRLMSMASSKGLTVRATIVVGVEQGIIPLSSGDAAEERRSLRAMTRSTQYLFLTWSQRRSGPTARTGNPAAAGGARSRSSLVTHGPVTSEDGVAYLNGIGSPQ